MSLYDEMTDAIDEVFDDLGIDIIFESTTYKALVPMGAVTTEMQDAALRDNATLTVKLRRKDFISAPIPKRGDIITVAEENYRVEKITNLPPHQLIILEVVL